MGAPLSEGGYPLAGSNQETIDLAEDRDRFRELLQQLNIPQPAGATATSLDRALAAADECGYPVLVRPSYVLGGQAMKLSLIHIWLPMLTLVNGNVVFKIK